MGMGSILERGNGSAMTKVARTRHGLMVVG